MEGMSAQTTTFLTPAEYLEQERRAERKSEYLQGEVFAMAGASRRHGLIVTNLTAELRQQLKGKPCEVYSSDLRLRVTAAGLYTYPDVMVVCGDVQFCRRPERHHSQPDAAHRGAFPIYPGL